MPIKNKVLRGALTGLVDGRAFYASLSVMAMVNSIMDTSLKGDNGVSQKTAITARVPHKSVALEKQFQVGHRTYTIG